MFVDAPTFRCSRRSIATFKHTAVQIMKQNTRRYFGGALRLCAVAAIALGTACASTPPAPDAALQAAQQSVTAAERDSAGQTAPGELGEARSKLAEAKVAVEAGRMASAERLALQSRAAAELASAKTAAVKALAVNAEMKASNAAMLNELNRNTGAAR